MQTLRIALLVFSLSGAHAAVPEWSGLFVVGGTARVTLVDPESKTTSGWLTIGDSFAGYVFKAYQPESTTLILEAEGNEISLHLRSATIKDSMIAFAGTISLGMADKLDVQKATLIYGQETTFPLAPDVMLTMKATKNADGTVTYRARVERTGTDGTKELLGDPIMICRPGQPFSVKIGDFGFNLQP